MPDFQSLAERWHQLRGELEAAGVRMLVVSKYAPDAAVQALIKAGERNFAEARAQQLRDRSLQWPACEWHMIGPTQKNKAKYIARHAAVWHSCEDIDVAARVAGYVKDQADERELPVLVQVNIAGNPEQHGVDPAKAGELADALEGMDGLRLTGLMGMAPRLVEGQEQPVRDAFRQLRTLRDDLFGGSFGELCMGMSNDYHIAVEEGATIVRLGTTVFGNLQMRS
ncbi:MAG: YggS family pyridoxal phosphate-dependent enzyme [Mariprofundaceae bacterium]